MSLCNTLRLEESAHVEDSHKQKSQALRAERQITICVVKSFETAKVATLVLAATNRTTL